MELEHLEVELSSAEHSYLQRILPIGFSLIPSSTRKTRLATGSLKKAELAPEVAPKRAATGQYSQHGQSFIQEKKTPKRARSRSFARGADRTWLEGALRIVEKLEAEEKIEPFTQPVSKLFDYLPGYFELVKHPMDLSTVKRKLTRGTYSTVAQFASDMRQIWTNAQIYNEPQSELYTSSLELSSRFEELVKDFKGAELSSMPQKKPQRKQKRSESPQEEPNGFNSEKRLELARMINSLTLNDKVQIWKIYAKYDGRILGSSEVVINIEKLPKGAFNEIYDYVKNTISKTQHPNQQPKEFTPQLNRVYSYAQSTMNNSLQTGADNSDIEDRRPSSAHNVNSPSKSSSFLTESDDD